MPLQIFLGYDEREHDAYTVAKGSIERRASVPVLITPLLIEHLGHLIPPNIHKDGNLWCLESEAPMSTEFARSRFCVPFLQRRGWALFADSDILCLADIKELFDLADERYAVMVVKHDHQPAATLKMAGQVQTKYPRKNWSSVILWNCSHPAHLRLSHDRLNRWPGRDLHAFMWLEDEEIGELSIQWNHLVGVTRHSAQPKILHYTNGGPFIPGWNGGPLDEIWRDELAQTK